MRLVFGPVGLGSAGLAFARIVWFITTRGESVRTIKHILCSVVRNGVHCGGAGSALTPPAPVVEAVGPVPFPGAVWLSGVRVWHPGPHRWEWHHGHWR